MARIALNLNLDEIPDLPMPISPGKYSQTFIDRSGRQERVVIELKGNLCPANTPLNCRECGDYVLGTCGNWSTSNPSESQKAAFRKLIVKVQEG
jgi:hypothetical protein